MRPSYRLFVYAIILMGCIALLVGKGFAGSALERNQLGDYAAGAHPNDVMTCIAQQLSPGATSQRAPAFYSRWSLIEI